MRFGKTKEEKVNDLARHWIKLAKGVKRFAWFPVKLDAGDWIWLSNYWTYARYLEFPQYLTGHYTMQACFVTRYANQLSEYQPKHSVVYVDDILGL